MPTATVSKKPVKSVEGSTLVAPAPPPMPTATVSKKTAHHKHDEPGVSPTVFEVGPDLLKRLIVGLKPVKPVASVVKPVKPVVSVVKPVVSVVKPVKPVVSVVKPVVSEEPVVSEKPVKPVNPEHSAPDSEFLKVWGRLQLKKQPPP